MPRRRRQKRKGRSDVDRARAIRAPAEPRLPTELQRGLGHVGLELARQQLMQRRWRDAYEFAEPALEASPEEAVAIMAEASSRQARRSALKGDLQAAQMWAHR